MDKTALYIASRYLIAKKGSTAVTIITWLAVLAMTFAVASMFIIISVFSGLENLNRELISNVHADITIKNPGAKLLQNIPKIESALKKNPEIAHFSKIIEEKVYIEFSGKGDIAYLRGVDSAYTTVNPVNKSIFYGTYPNFQYINEGIMENQLDNRLAIPVNSDRDFAMIYMPKAGKGMINKEEDIFNKKELYVTGVFSGNDQLENYIISPIELTQQLLEIPKNSAYQIVAKLKNPENADAVKATLTNVLGKNISVTTKSEENAAFWKMINTEKIFIYLIFALVIFITTFNLAGAIIILQLDKKDQAKSLVSMGYSVRSLRTTYFYTGVLIVIAGILAGLSLGTAICLLQKSGGYFKASETMPFPVEILPVNYIFVAATAAFFSIIVSLIFSKINPNYLRNF